MEEKSYITDANQLMSLMIACPMMAHIHHLQCEGENSYARHIILKEFYEKITPLVDNLIEAYQGLNEKIVRYEPFYFAIGLGGITSLEYLRRLRISLQFAKRQYLVSPLLDNEVDAILSLINTTIYKLTFLK